MKMEKTDEVGWVIAPTYEDMQDEGRELQKKENDLQTDLDITKKKLETVKQDINCADQIYKLLYNAFVLGSVEEYIDFSRVSDINKDGIVKFLYEDGEFIDCFVIEKD
jgi:hypothetical protein